MKDKPIVDNEYLLEKYPGKGGWTYAAIPELLQDKDVRSGWVKVKGRIDDYEISDFSLAPMGNGRLFFPVKAEIRKRIRKEAGDYVKIVLYPDRSVFEVPQEILDCLGQEPEAQQIFVKLTSGKQREIVKWIYTAKREETRAQRIMLIMEKLLKGQI